MSTSGNHWCGACSSHFKDLDADARPEWDPDSAMTLWNLHCPFCGEGDEVEDAYRCDECADWFAGTILDEDLCPKCYPIVMERENG